MPVPVSARSVSRVSNWAVKPTWPRTSSGIPRSARIERRTPLSAGSCSSSEPTPLGSASVRRLSMRIAICGAWAALAKVLSTSPERCDLGAHEVEGLAVEPGLVGDVVHRGGHVVDRHDVRVAQLEADEREPLGQRVARLLDRLEEVVGPVDLVHLAGLRVADDDRGPVDAPRDARLLARDLLGVELRAGGRTTAASGPRRTCPRGTCPCSRPATATDEAWCRMPASSALASADRVARAGRRWRGRWPRRRPSCRRPRRGGRSGRSCRGARRSSLARRRGAPA